MLVEEIMKTEVITLSPEETIETALKLLHENHIRHLPIVDENNEVIGIVSDRDVRDASPSIFEEDASPDELKKSHSDNYDLPSNDSPPTRFRRRGGLDFL